MNLTMKKRLRNVAIGVLFFLSGVEYAVILPSLWLFLEGFGAHLDFFGLVFAAFSMSGLFAGPLFGLWVDCYQKTKLVILTANMFEIVGNFLYFISWNKYWVLASRFICGLGSGTNAAIFAEMTWTTTDEERTAVFSLAMGTRNIGLLVGPGLNILFKNWDFYLGPFHINNYRAPGFFMSTTWLLAQVIVICLYFDLSSLESQTLGIIQTKERNAHHCYGSINAASLPSHSDNGPNGDSENYNYDDDVSMKQLAASLKIVKRERSLSISQHWSLIKELLKEEVLVVLISQFIMFFNETAFEALCTPLMEKLLGWNTVDNSILFCSIAVESIFIFLLVSWLSHKVSDRWLLLFGIFVEGLALVLYIVLLGNVKPYSPVILPTIVVGTFLIVMGIPFFAVSGASLFSKLTDSRTQGVGHGIRRSFTGLAMIMGPLWAAGLVNNLYLCMGVMAALLLLLSVMMSLSFRKLQVPVYGLLPPSPRSDRENNIAPVLS